MENVVADPLSRLTIAYNTHNPPIYDEFLEESLLTVDSAPWFAHIANFLVTGELPTDGKHRTRSSSMKKSTLAIGKNPICLNTVLIK